ncbi:unnamed protein product [Prunus brigantina]
MIGRADIEGSKSNVAMNAWLPQAGYPCGCSTPGKVPKERSRSVPRPARGDPLSPRERLERSTERPTGSGPGTPVPGPRANPFPEVTDPFCRLPLPTLFHRPRGCSPWRHDAVMSTARA